MRFNSSNKNMKTLGRLEIYSIFSHVLGSIGSLGEFEVIKDFTTQYFILAKDDLSFYGLI